MIDQAKRGRATPEMLEEARTMASSSPVARALCRAEDDLGRIIEAWDAGDGSPEDIAEAIRVARWEVRDER